MTEASFVCTELMDGIALLPVSRNCYDPGPESCRELHSHSAYRSGRSHDQYVQPGDRPSLRTARSALVAGTVSVARRSHENIAGGRGSENRT